MTTVVRRRTVDASPAWVWATLADFGSIARWAPMVDHSCLTTSSDDPTTMTRRVQIGSMTLLEDVVRWNPPNELAYRLRGLPPIVGPVETSWTLRPAGTADHGSNDRRAVGDRGRCEIEVSTSVLAGGRPAQAIAARVVARRLGRTADDMLDGLARFVSHAAPRPTASVGRNDPPTMGAP